MRRLFSPLNVMLVLMLTAVVPQQAFQGPPQAPPQGPPQGPPPDAPGQRGQRGGGPPPPSFPSTDPVQLPLNLFQVPDGLEVTLWATTPMLRNPANIDIDKDGRIWVAEGVRYRSHFARQPEGDKIVVLQDTDGDGKADSTHTFVQEPALIAPLGVSVIDNKIIVAQPPDMIVYTDVDRNLKFDPAVDKREVLLSGFQGINHDHSLHSVTVGPDGKWVWNAGNTGAMFTDKSGKTFRIFGSYRPGAVGPFKFPHDPAEYAGKPSDDGHVYVGGFTVRMNPDGTNAEIIGSNYRNSYEQSVTSLGDIFQNDNDDPPACRVSWVMDTRTSASRRTMGSGRGRPTAGQARPPRWPSGGRTIRGWRRSATSTAAARPPATCSMRTAPSVRRLKARSSPQMPGATRSSRISRRARAPGSRWIAKSS